MTNNIIAYWTLNEDGWPDTNGNYNLTEGGTVVATSAGKVSNAASFNGSSDQLELADADAFSVVNNSMTFSVWIYLDRTNTSSPIIVKRTTDEGHMEYYLYYSSTANTFTFTYYTNAATSTAVKGYETPVQTNQWYFLVAQIDKDSKTHRLRWGETNENANVLYPWGTASPTWNAFTGTNTDSTFRLMKLGTTAGTYTVGKIDEVGVWGRLLSDTEITNLWKEGWGVAWPLQ